MFSFNAFIPTNIEPARGRYFKHHSRNPTIKLSQPLLIFSLIFFISGFIRVYSQDFCLSVDLLPIPAPPPTATISEPCDLRFIDEALVLQNPFGPCYAENSDNFIVQIYVHVLTKLDGSGAQSLAVINQEINKLVESYSEFGITFSFVGFEYLLVDDPTYNVSSRSEAEDVSVINGSDERIDLYFCGPGIFDNAIAFYTKPNPTSPYEITGTACVIGGGNDTFFTNCNQGPILPSIVVAHEVGHILGLLHTGEFL